MLTHGALHRLAIDRPPVSRAFDLPYRVQRNFARLGRAQRLLLPAKLEFVGRMFLVGVGDFSPPNGYVFGTEVPCSEGFEPPPNCSLSGSWLASASGT